MAEKKKFLLRIDESIYNSMEKWAADELRSINGQIEYVLKDALRKSGRLKETNSVNDQDTTGGGTNQ
ncbi:MAG: Arc family DNA-binding protein [Bacteroidota bacterium]